MPWNSFAFVGHSSQVGFGESLAGGAARAAIRVGVMKLATTIHFARPAFIIDETLIPGAIDLNGMQEMVKAARSKLKASGDAQKN